MPTHHLGMKQATDKSLNRSNSSIAGKHVSEHAGYVHVGQISERAKHSEEQLMYIGMKISAPLHCEET